MGDGIRIFTSPFVPEGMVAVMTAPVPFKLELPFPREPLVRVDDNPDAFNIRFRASFVMPPPQRFAVIHGLDEYPPRNWYRRRRKNPARTTWGHQRP